MSDSSFGETDVTADCVGRDTLLLVCVEGLNKEVEAQTLSDGLEAFS